MSKKSARLGISSQTIIIIVLVIIVVVLAAAYAYKVSAPIINHHYIAYS